MKFEQAAGPNPTDQGVVLGKPLSRLEAALKVTGTAPYAADWHEEVPGLVYGYVLGAAIACGRIKSFDTSAAQAMPRVLKILLSTDYGRLAKGKLNPARLFGGDRVEHYHQAVALVVAENFETARAAASAIKVDYEESNGNFDLAARRDKSEPAGGFGGPADKGRGNFDQAYQAAPVQLDATYSTANYAHAMMEPFASVARWDGGKLTVWTSNQMIAWGRRDLAATLKMKPENIRFLSPYIGGGFGGKLFLRADAVLAALGAQAAGRPVKVVLQRPLVFNNTTHRSATIQRLRLGANNDGSLAAWSHENWSGNLEGGGPEQASQASSFTYACDNRETHSRLVRLNLPESNAMRAPGDAPGSFALEVAMDELAEKLGIDPVELRVRNDRNQGHAEPLPQYAGRDLTECLQRGARIFGWEKRIFKPAQVREGRLLIGMGVAGAERESPAMESGARVRLTRDGRLIVETDMTDIGTGSYTIIGQTAAEMMGLPIERVAVRLGDSDYPVSAGSGGQFGAVCSTSGVYAACMKLREAAARRLGMDPATVQFIDGYVVDGNERVPLSRAATLGELVGEDSIEFAGDAKDQRTSAFGAHFVEVAVDADTAEVRLRRMLAVVSAGRILNPRTARSQVIGAMIMGAGSALREELIPDTRVGYFVNHDMAQYEVPVHADAPPQQVEFLDKVDPYGSPMKARGVGELGICGVSAAIANAVYNAAGARIRDFPITIDKLLPQLPVLA